MNCNEIMLEDTPELRQERRTRQELIDALKDAAKLVKIARRYFPKSMHNSDKFTLELTCAMISKALDLAERKQATEETNPYILTGDELKRAELMAKQGNHA